MADKNVAEAEVVEEAGTAVVAQFDVAGAIASLNDPSSAFYSSIKGDNFAGKRDIAKALTTSIPIADNLHKEIALVDVIVQSVQIADEETGEVTEAPRVTLIAEDGSAYNGTSVGLLNSVRQIFSSLGEPTTWPEPLPIKIVEKKGRRGWRYMTVELV